MAACIVMLGAIDTKATEYAYLRDRLLARGHLVLAVNIGVLGGTECFPVDVPAADVARAAGADLNVLREIRDRGAAMKAMAQGAVAVVLRLHAEGKLHAVIGMGGTGGSSVIAAAMRALPVGVPKVLVSTAAGGDTSTYVGLKDVTMIPSIVDIAGLNRISRLILARAAGAVCGMAEADVPTDDESKPIIAATMFGNTTACVDACTKALEAAGYEVLVFHATGIGGRAMEALVEDGLVDGVLDITTTEWADAVCGGIFSAGETRLDTPGRKGLPHLIVPGCIDMVNFGPADTVPKKYRDAGRILYEWNPAVTLMRTNAEENRHMGEIFAQKANAANGPVAFLLPLRGVSILDGDGERFCDRSADSAFAEALKANLRAGIPVEELDANINNEAFSKRATERMLELIAQVKRA